MAQMAAEVGQISQLAQIPLTNSQLGQGGSDPGSIGSRVQFVQPGSQGFDQLSNDQPAYVHYVQAKTDPSYQQPLSTPGYDMYNSQHLQTAPSSIYPLHLTNPTLGAQATAVSGATTGWMGARALAYNPVLGSTGIEASSWTPKLLQPTPRSQTKPQTKPRATSVLCSITRNVCTRNASSPRLTDKFSTSRTCVQI